MHPNSHEMVYCEVYCNTMTNKSTQDISDRYYPYNAAGRFFLKKGPQTPSDSDKVLADIPQELVYQMSVRHAWVADEPLADCQK